MLKGLIGLEGMSVAAADDEVGTVARFLVDTNHWVVTHVVVATGHWLPEAEIVIPPSLLSLGGDESAGLALPVARDQISRIVAGASGDGLRESSEFVGLHLVSSDGEIGHLDDLLVEVDEGSGGARLEGLATWHVRYVVVDPSNWWLGKHVLISPDWIERFDWNHRRVHVNVEREAIKQAPEYDAGYLLTRADEAEIFRHYRRRPYWDAADLEHATNVGK